MSEATESAAQKKEPFLSKWDWWAFWVTTVVSLAVYVWTLSPTVSLEDSGELAVAGDYLGVPHPPGYPLWTILAWIFTKIFFFKTTPPVFEQPNPAWSIGLMSGVFGALASGITAMLICRSGRDMLHGLRRTHGAVSHGLDDLMAFAGGIAGSLLFAFSSVMWSQCVIVEVYSLNAFFVALILMLAYAWMCRPSDRLLYWIAISFGLGMGNWWPSVLLTLGPLVLVVLFKDLKLFSSFAAVGAVVCGMIVLNVVLKEVSGKCDEVGRALYPWTGDILWLRGPTSWPFWIYTAINFGALALAWFFLPRGKTVAVTFLIAELGLLIYLYMPISSETNPPMNWGYPRTWEGFLHAVGRGQYEKITPTDMFSIKFIDQIGAYMSELRWQFTLPIAVLGFLPFAGWSVRIGSKRASAFTVAVLLGAAAAALLLFDIMLYKPDEPLLILGGIRPFIPLTAPILGLLAVGFAALVFAEMDELIRKFRAGDGVSIGEQIIIVGVFVGTFLLLLYYEASLARKMTDPELKLAASGKAAIALIMCAPLALSAVVLWLMFGPADLRFDMDRNSQKWIIVTVSAFVLMSFAMVLAANPKCDIQDMFIQRVKFVTSHALYSFWIGYGCILVLAFAVDRLGGSKPVGFLAAAFAMLMPVYPLVQNAPFYVNRYNSEMLKAYGGTSQRGHDFGWQFGNYQLRGIEEILRELKPGEEPPPSKEYPPPMGQNAIFFGGTDPGRFVPTYMIFSAHVREDVFLITQNALADHTYMSVMRDLYGDKIWIPSAADSAEAFRQYTEEVRAGRLPGKIDVRSGRLIVQGVDQVMQINGFLCKMMHDRNKWKHDFYVEESYVIPWMYPYMEPHGLILKLNAKPLNAIPKEVVENDMAFWKWYKNRLVNDRKFVNDAVARKSFSKLRSAIAGLYEFRNMKNQAEIAYKEAMELCPVSPEAHFRLAGMYMRYGEVEKAEAVTEEFGRQDPNNDRTESFLKQIRSRKTLILRKKELEDQVMGKNKRVDITAVMELAEIYRQLNFIGPFRQLAQNVLSQPNLPPDVYLRMAKMYLDAGMPEEMDKAIKTYLGNAPKNIPTAHYKRMAELYAFGKKLGPAVEMMRQYLARVPVDYKAWSELGVMYFYLQKPNESLGALQQAVRVGGNKAKAEIRADERLASFLQNPEVAKILR